MLDIVGPGLFSYGEISHPTAIIYWIDLYSIIYSKKYVYPIDENDFDILPNRIFKLKNIMKNKQNIVIVCYNDNDRLNSILFFKFVENVILFLLRNCVTFLIWASINVDSVKYDTNIIYNSLKSKFSTKCQNKLYYISSKDNNYLEHNHSIQKILPDNFFPQENFNIPRKKFICIFVGIPGSGKTTFYYKNFDEKNHIRVTNYEDALRYAKLGYSLVVDNTNEKTDERKKYISLMRSHNMVGTIIHFLTKKIEKHIQEYDNFFEHFDEPTFDQDYIPIIKIA